MGGKSKKTDELLDAVFDSTYAAIADPEHLDNFLRAWESYMEACLKSSGADNIVALNDPSIHAHFERGMKIFHRIGRIGVASDTPQSIVDATVGICIIINQHGQIIAFNNEAKALVEQNSGFSELDINNVAKSQILQWTRNRTSGTSQFLFTPCNIGEPGKKSCLLTSALDDPLLSNGSSPQAGQSPTMYSMVTSIDLNMDASALASMMVVYDLSEAEANVALQISEGVAPSEIAKNRNVSVNTIRTQMRTIFAKTETKGIPDLVRLLCGFIASHPVTGDGIQQAVEKYGSHVRKSAIELSDGRTLSYFEMGDPNGTPVLFFHSIICGPLLTDRAAEACEKAKIRIIAPSMPGYGDSTPNSDINGEEMVASIANDYSQLLDELKIYQVLSMGHIVGAVMAQGFVKHRPERARGLMFVGHAAHFNEDFFNDMPTLHRIWGKTILKAPAVLPFFVRASIALIDTNDQFKLIKATHNPCEVDYRALQHPDVLDVVVDGIKHAVVQGVDAFCQYSKISLSDWLHHAHEIDVPVSILHGAEDDLITEQYILPYLTVKPDTTHTSVESTGKYLLYSHWQYVMKQLILLNKRAD